MTNTREMGEWMERAGRLKQAGASSIDVPELVAVYAAFYPDSDPLRTNCRKCVIDGYQAVLRYLRLNTSTDSTTSLSTTMADNVARFKSENTQYFPFGLGVVYTNANLTDKIARRILKDDPDAARLFETLPGPAPVKKDEGEKASKKAAKAPASAAPATPVADTKPPVVLSEDLHRDELEAIYADEVKEGDPKAFANKGELIAAIEKFRAAQPAQ